MRNERAASLISDPSVPPPALLTLLMDALGKSWITGEFDSVLDDIREGIGQPHPIVIEKIRALRTCAHTAAPWERFEVFAVVAQALNGFIPDFSSHTVLEPYELALAIRMINHVRSGEEFSDEVRKYVAASISQEGLYFASIPSLNMARKFFRPYNYSAEALFRFIKDKPLSDVEVPENNDGYQAVIGRAQFDRFSELEATWF